MLLYINDLPDDSICNFAIHADDILFSEWVRLLTCDNIQSRPLRLNLTHKSFWAEGGIGLMILLLQLVSFDVKMDVPVFNKK